MQLYGYVYMTVNLTNGKRYIGQTNYSRPDHEEYLGSGKYFKQAVSKYGRSNFRREILFVAFTAEDLNWAEREFISEYSAVSSRDFYNVSPGGKASLGFTGRKHTPERNKRLSEKLMGHSVSSKARSAVSKTGKESSKILNATIVKCPHCGLSGTLPPMKRWHFTHCKLLANKMLDD